MPDPRVKRLEAPLRLWHLLLHPGREVKAVIEDLKVRWAGLRERFQ